MKRIEKETREFLEWLWSTDCRKLDKQLQFYENYKAKVNEHG